MPPEVPAGTLVGTPFNGAQPDRRVGPLVIGGAVCVSDKETAAYAIPAPTITTIRAIKAMIRCFLLVE
jgi:hypothetical protein